MGTAMVCLIDGIARNISGNIKHPRFLLNRFLEKNFMNGISFWNRLKPLGTKAFNLFCSYIAGNYQYGIIRAIILFKESLHIIQSCILDVSYFLTDSGP